MARCVIQRCCCLSIKDGLEAFAYIKIMISYTTVLYLTGGFYAQYQNTGQVDVPVTTAAILCSFTGDFVMTLLHIYSLRKNILPLIHVYLYYVVLTLVVMIVGLPFYFYYVVLGPEPALALYNTWAIVGTAVVAWTCIGLHILLAFAVYSYGVVVTKLRRRELRAKTETEMRRVSV
ncbi:uncharacterized protein LOC121734740 [Aricia agestis]|uniref:uncharacterized protein LOC121734740 n=1 Tax=Aricia agestis TaxID=91739 RepID=UPI001C20199F|nr:uncharacterized protein LOC121734740 [Aricia agestis]